MRGNFKKKAFERLETAEWCIDRGFICSRETTKGKVETYRDC